MTCWHLREAAEGVKAIHKRTFVNAQLVNEKFCLFMLLSQNTPSTIAQSHDQQGVPDYT